MISMITLNVLIFLQKIHAKKTETKILTTRRVNEDFFPKIRVCFSITNDYGDSLFFSDPRYKNYFYGPKFSNQMKTSSFYDAEMYVNNLLRNYKFLSRELQNSQHIYSNISILECTYLGQNCNKVMSNSFYYDSGIGRCILFESKKKNFGAFSRVGKEFGLSVLLKSQISDIKNHFRKVFGYLPYLSVHYQILNPKGEDKKNHLLTTFHADVLPLGHEVNIPITITKEIKNKNTSNCLDYNAENPNDLHLFDSYTYDSCYTNCLKLLQLARCQNDLPFFPRICSKEKPCDCDNVSCFNCSSNVLFPDNLKIGILHPEFKDKCSCPLPCESYSFKTIPSYSKLHTKNMAEMLDLKGSDEDLEDDISANYVMLNFFIKEITVLTKKEEVFYRSANMFAEIGNTLSLLLGLGMINIVEIFFCFFFIIIDRIRYFIKFRRLY
uniref:Acid-sensing ion channel 5 n=1 Tax=Strongyloides venezuelensis TaxID=75913 RepID=A0A0K0F4I6_STRVS